MTGELDLILSQPLKDSYTLEEDQALVDLAPRLETAPVPAPPRRFDTELAKQRPELYEFREQHPQFDNWSDEDLAKSLHQRFYSAWEWEDFARKLNIDLPQPPQPEEEGSSFFEQLKGSFYNWRANRATASAMTQLEAYEDAPAVARGAQLENDKGVGLGGRLLLDRQARDRQNLDALARSGNLEAQRRINGTEARLRAKAANELQSLLDFRRDMIARSEGIAPSAVTQEMMSAKTFLGKGGALDELADAPLQIAAEVTIQSLPNMIDGMALGVAAGLATGPLGMAGGMGMGSAMSEYRASLAQGLQERGVDLNSADSLLEAYANKQLMSEATQDAMTRAGIIGLFDGVSGGVAGKTLTPFVKGAVTKMLANQAAQMGAQAALGAAGEAGAQLATEGQITEPGGVLAEAVGEGLTGVAEVGVAAAVKQVGPTEVKGPDPEVIHQEVARVAEEVERILGPDPAPQPAPQEIPDFSDDTDPDIVDEAALEELEDEGLIVSATPPDDAGPNLPRPYAETGTAVARPPPIADSPGPTTRVLDDPLAPVSRGRTGIGSVSVDDSPKEIQEELRRIQEKFSAIPLSDKFDALREGIEPRSGMPLADALELHFGVDGDASAWAERGRPDQLPETRRAFEVLTGLPLESPVDLYRGLSGAHVKYEPGDLIDLGISWSKRPEVAAYYAGAEPSDADVIFELKNHDKGADLSMVDDFNEEVITSGRVRVVSERAEEIEPAAIGATAKMYRVFTVEALAPDTDPREAEALVKAQAQSDRAVLQGVIDQFPYERGRRYTSPPDIETYSASEIQQMAERVRAIEARVAEVGEFPRRTEALLNYVPGTGYILPSAGERNFVPARIRVDQVTTPQGTFLTDAVGYPIASRVFSRELPKVVQQPNGKFLIDDGNHRIGIAAFLGEEEVDVLIHDGPGFDAWKDADSINDAAGMPHVAEVRLGETSQQLKAPAIASLKQALDGRGVTVRQRAPGDFVVGADSREELNAALDLAQEMLKQTEVSAQGRRIMGIPVRATVVKGGPDLENIDALLSLSPEQLEAAGRTAPDGTLARAIYDQLYRAQPDLARDNELLIAASKREMPRETVYRGMRMSLEEAANTLLPGQPIKLWGASSFSSNREVAEVWIENGSVGTFDPVESPIKVIVTVDAKRGLDLRKVEPGDEIEKLSEILLSGELKIKDVERVGDTVEVQAEQTEDSIQAMDIPSRELPARPEPLQYMQGPKAAPYIGLEGQLPRDANHNHVLANGRRVRLNTDVPIRRAHVLNRLERLEGLNIYQGDMHGPSTRLGYYRKDHGAIRIRHVEDIEAVAHEVGHWIDDRFAWVQPLYAQHAEELIGISTDNASASEGFAEYMRLLFTQEQYAVSRAPEFDRAFRQKLADMSKANAENARLEAAIWDVQELMHGWMLQGAAARGVSKVTQDKPTIFEKISRLMPTRFTQKAFDAFHSIQKAEWDIAGPRATEAYRRMRVAYGGYNGAIEAFFFFGTGRLNDAKDGLEFTGKGLRQIFGNLWGDERLGRYMLGRRAAELREQGRENLLREDEIQAFLAEAQANPEFETIWQEYQGYNQRMLDFAEDMGILSPEAREAISEANKNYVPFYRVTETVMGEPKTASPSGNPFRRLQGGERAINDVWENIVSNTGMVIRSGFINHGKRGVFRMIEGATNQQGAMYAEPIPAANRSVSLSTEVVRQAALQSMGMTKDQYKLAKKGFASDEEIATADLIDRMVDGMGQVIEVFQGGVEPRTMEGLVDGYMEDGQRRYFQIKDPGMIDTMLFLRPKELNVVEGVLLGFSAALRRGVTPLPKFVSANLIRDSFQSWIAGRHHLPFANATVQLVRKITTEAAAKAGAPVDLQAQPYAQMLLNGGGFSTVSQGLQPGRNVIADPRAFAQAYDRFTSTMENANRLAEFEKARRDGFSKLDAAYMSREISTDFAMRGSSETMRWISMSIPFLNARLQGLYNMYRKGVLNEGDLRLSMALKGTALIMMSVGLRSLTKDDERVEELPEDVRDRFWVIPWGEQADDLYFVPKPHEYGFVFGSIPERAYDLYGTGDTERFQRAMAWMTFNVLHTDAAPQVVKPLYDLARNKNFTGAPIVPRYLEGVQADQQYTYYTSLAMRKLGEQTGMSPIQMEYAVRGYFGSMGAYALQASDAIVRNTVGDEYGDRPTDPNDPLTQAIAPWWKQEGPRRRTRQSEDFYRMAREVDEVTKTFALRRRRQAESIEGWLARPENYRLYQGSRLAQTGLQQLSQLRSAMDRVRYNAALTADQKRDQLFLLIQQRNALTSQLSVELRGVLDQVQGR